MPRPISGSTPCAAAPASFVCEPQIEELWAKHQASADPEERDRLVKAIQHIIIEEYYFVPIYLNPFVHAVGPRVLPEGKGFTATGTPLTPPTLSRGRCGRYGRIVGAREAPVTRER